MFIYFCGSIRGGRQDAEVYAVLIKKLQSYGTVLTEHVGHEHSEKNAEKHTDKEHHDRDMKFMDQCDVIVAEVTQPSLGVGYELGRAVTMNKRVLCLYREGADRKLSCMIRGAENGDNFIVKDYKMADADEIFSEFLGGKEQNNGNEAEAEEKDDDDDLVEDEDDGEGEDEEEDAEDQ